MRLFLATANLWMWACTQEERTPAIEDRHRVLAAGEVEYLEHAYDDWARWTGARGLGIRHIRLIRGKRDRLETLSVRNRDTLYVHVERHRNHQNRLSLYHQLCHVLDEDRGFSARIPELSNAERERPEWAEYSERQRLAEVFALLCESGPFRAADRWYVTVGEPVCGAHPGISDEDRLLITDVYPNQRPRDDGDFHFSIGTPVALPVPKRSDLGRVQSIAAVGDGLAIVRANSVDDHALEWFDRATAKSSVLVQRAHENGSWNVFGGPDGGALVIDHGPKIGTIFPISSGGVLGLSFDVEGEGAVGQEGVVGGGVLFMTNGIPGTTFVAYDLAQRQRLQLGLPNLTTGGPSVIVQNFAATRTGVFANLAEGRVSMDHDYMGISLSRESFHSELDVATGKWTERAKTLLPIYETDEVVDRVLLGTTFGPSLLAAYMLDDDRLLVSRDACFKGGRIVVFGEAPWLIEHHESVLVLSPISLDLPARTTDGGVRTTEAP